MRALQGRRRLIPTNKRLAIYGGVLLGLVLVKALWVVWFCPDGARLIAGGEKADILARRAYLVDEVYGETLGVDAMPSSIGPLFQGEWAVGTHSMTALALANIAFLYPETRARAHRVVGAIVERMLTPELRAFDEREWGGRDPLETLRGSGGHIGYLGHLNMCLAAYHYLGKDRRYEALFQRVSATLARRLEASPFLHIETYPGEIYNMDNAVVVASLALFNRRFPGRGTTVPARWLAYCDRHLRDPVTGLFPFALSARGKPIQTCRGSGAGWNAFFLFYADPAFARAQFARIKEHLVKRLPLGITGIREFPEGRTGNGDVDSGPVIFELSTSGTGFAVAGARFTGDARLLSDLLYTAEVAGFTMQWSGRRWYLLAPLVGDAIMLAMKTITPWDLRYVRGKASPR